MNDERSTPDFQLSHEELRHLLREGDPPFTRREIRMRDRAEEAGLLERVDGKLQIASEPPPAEPGTASKPSAPDIAAGRVSHTTGLTRRQLRELAAQQAAEKEQNQEPAVDTGSLEETVESVLLPPERISTRSVADELQSGAPTAPESPVEQTARRPVIRPAGASTGEYTGEFDQIRQAMADINAAPDAQPATPPARRSIFEAAIPEEFTRETAASASENTDTDAADVSTLMDLPVVTDDVFTEELVADAPERPAEPNNAVNPRELQPEASTPPAQPTFPDWHAISEVPVPAPSAQPADPAASEENTRARPSLLLTILQWIVIVVIAIVLGLLVWYAIARGFGEDNPDAAGIYSALYYLRL